MEGHRCKEWRRREAADRHRGLASERDGELTRALV